MSSSTRAATRLALGPAYRPSRRYHQRAGEYPKERPLTPQDLLATVYRHLGIDPRHELRDAAGRPIPVLAEGQPIAELY